MKDLSSFSQAADCIKMGAIYEHYKGNLYKVISLARHTETLEEFVVYRALYEEGHVWIRPLSMFVENVQVEEKSIPRFKYIQSDL